MTVDELRSIRGMENHLNEIGKFLLAIDRQRSKYRKLHVPFPVIIALDEAYIRTKDWYHKYESDLEELRCAYINDEHYGK